MALRRRVRRIEERYGSGNSDDPLVLLISFVEPTPNGPGASRLGRCLIIDGGPGQTFLRSDDETDEAFLARIKENTGVEVKR